MSSRRFIISIHVSRKNTYSGDFFDVPYPGKTVAKSGDTIRFLKQKIIIIADRSVNPKNEEILENRTNSLHIQIIKSLLYLYVANRKRIYVRSIEIKKGKEESNIFKLNRDSQPISGEFAFSRSFPDAIKHLLLQETPAAVKLRVILTQLLGGMGDADRYLKFERFWRCYEQICIWHKYKGVLTGKPNEFDSIALMRNYITSNPATMTESTRLTSIMTYDELFELFSWYQYVNNEFTIPGTNKMYANYYNYFICNYTDNRIMQLHKTLLPYREERLKFYGFFAVAQAYIITHTTPPLHKKDEELVAFLCGRYGYFLRNKMFHGELADYTFRFYAKIREDKTIDVLCKLLQASVEDLLMVFDTL